MKEWLVKLNLVIHAWWKSLSLREHLLVAGGCVILVLMSGYYVYTSVSDSFLEQNLRIAAAEGEMRQAVNLVARYSKLKSLKDEIESKYKQVELHEGALSHLEKILRDIGEIPQEKITIRQEALKPLGESYEQTPFYIDFDTTDFSKLVSLLKEIVEGKHPLIMGLLSMEKRAGNVLKVGLRVSSIKRIGSPPSETNAETPV